jgi:multiple sugar transport system ATP-binding protein
MNMVNGHLESRDGGVYAVFGTYALEVDPRALERHGGIEDYMSKELVIGIRPGDFEDERIAGANPARTMEVPVDVVEVLGSETFCHYQVQVAPVITPEIEELLADTGADAASLGQETKFASRVSSDVMINPGSRARLVVDTSKFHFFDPDSGERIGFREGSFRFVE